ncbi:DNA-binding SARP family transcriptional activator/WD40 repeat protein/energy-coupling factor transporter ATP-binding protein EcfA2 [Nocardioides ginsengisegetis]|uniref:DNA-binding SARP family transcriptional activator/WD40 repeat protein/energy-coupling factor transporter ATP-binding protein EcfA2 n=1 Tax=Nocardioides ginsengisegetis TaxID=661491 RepID=A0A7W3IWF5_9ACTN|nr:BTAD domain-containing putative transcriptional regulator [Nocardioides ginsengisegetis]MBA8801871.1 DNA-binding SARP family transcriptional activator/WD40 repeat protein/energy-coupling factor transporter ATP-binding protein EcfA2 [Nocardioides ginsengisegetis]
MELRVLGPLEAAEDGRPVRLGARLPQVVLAVLAVHAPHTVTRDALIEQVWPHDPPNTAVNALQIYVSQVRKAIGKERIRTTGAGYALHLDRSELDAWRFADLLRDGMRCLDAGEAVEAAERLRAALALWRGTAYSGLDTNALLATEAGRLEEQRLIALEARIEADLQCGRHVELVPELEALTRSHPLRERLWAQLMRALYGADRQADALETFRRARDILRDELGIDPGPELQDLEQAVLRHDVHLRDAVAPALPPLPAALAAPGPTFVGRDADLAWLLAALDRAAAGEAVTALVQGASGSGKTRLVAELARVARTQRTTITYARGLEGLATADERRSATDDSADSTRLVVLDDIATLPSAASPVLARLLETPSAGTLTVLCLAPEEAPLPVRVVLARCEKDRRLVSRTLGGLALDDIRHVAHTYAPTAAEDEIDDFARSAPTDPQSVHEAASQWATSRAGARLTAAAANIPDAAARMRDHHDTAVTALLEARHAQDLRRAHEGLDRALLTPYRGLAAYQEGDAALFFGRERVVADLLVDLLRTRFLTLVGPSGAGKSSIVRAGVVPSLRAGALPGSEGWHIEVQTPLAISEGAWHAPGTGGRLLVVDQLEEVLTTLPPPSRLRFEQLLTEALEDPGTRVVATLRSDFYPRLSELPRFRAWLGEGTVLLGSIGATELRQIVEQPALVAGLQLEPGLVDQVLADTGELSGALPLLSTALLSLWEHRDGDKLTLRSYRASGGVATAIRRAAESAFSSLTADEQTAARRVLVRLTDPAESERYVRRRAPAAELAPPGDVAAARVVETFAGRRLLTVDAETVEVAHESLFTEWPRLHDWLREDAEGRRLRRELTPAVTRWATSGRQPGDLYRGPRLVAAVEFAEAYPGDLTPPEQEFLRASRDLDEQDRVRRARSLRRLRGLAAGLALAVVASALAAGLALHQQHRADAQRAAAQASALRADSRRVAAQALVERQPDTALLMAAQGLRLDTNSDTRATMLTLLQRFAPLTAVLHPGVGAAWHIRVSPDGRLAAVTSVVGRAGTALIDLRSHATLGVAPGAGVGEFSPDSRFLALVANREVHVYDTTRPLDQQEPRVVRVPRPSGELAFVDEDRRLVAAGYSGDYRHLSLDSWPLVGAGRPTHLATVAAPPDRTRDNIPLGGLAHPSIESFAVWNPTPDGGLFAVPSPLTAHEGDQGRVVGTVSITPSGSVHRSGPLRIPNASGTWSTFALRPDGKVLATQTDSALVLTAASTGRALGVYHHATDAPGHLTWSPDGRYLASAGLGGTSIFTGHPLRLVQELHGHDGEVTDVDFGASGGSLYTSGADGQLLAWDPGVTALWHALDRGAAIGDSIAILFTVPPRGDTILATRVDGPRTEVRLCPRNDPACTSGPPIDLDGDLGRASSDRDGTRFLVEVSPHGSHGPPVWHLLDDSGRDTELTASGVRGTRSLDLSRRATWTRALLTPDGQHIAALLADGTLGVWTTDPFRLSRRVSLRTAPPAPAGATTQPPGLVGVTPDSRQLVVVDGLGLYVVDLTTGEFTMPPEQGPGGRITAFALSDDGGRAATGYNDGRVQVWSTSDWALEPFSLEPHRTAVTSLAFAGDELLTASRDEVRMFDLSSPAPATERLTAPPWAAELGIASPGPGRLLGYGPGMAGPFEPVTWQIDPATLVRRACEVAGRDLTANEWRRVLPGRAQVSTCS